MNGKVVAVVTDNKPKMGKMRSDLKADMAFKDIEVFGCSAHLFDLLLEKFCNIPKWNTVISTV